MKIDNLKDLKKLIDLCRKTGIEAIEVDGVKMNLGPMPTTQARIAPQSSILAPADQTEYIPGGITETMSIPTNDLTEEQMLFWSSQGQNSETQ